MQNAVQVEHGVQTEHLENKHDKCHNLHVKTIKQPKPGVQHFLKNTKIALTTTPPSYTYSQL